MPPATPRPAASLVLVRDTAEGPQVLLGRRRADAASFPGRIVFPGGKVEAGDRAAEADAGFGSGAAPAPPGSAFAALRELFEETGVWLSDAASPFPRRPALERLATYAHWITPASFPYRFDTWFFLALASPAEAAVEPAGEEFEALSWMAPARALAEHRHALLPPTLHTLQRLAPSPSGSAIVADARASSPFEADDATARWAAASQAAGVAP